MDLVDEGGMERGGVGGGLLDGRTMNDVDLLGLEEGPTKSIVTTDVEEGQKENSDNRNEGKDDRYGNNSDQTGDDQTNRECGQTGSMDDLEGSTDDQMGSLDGQIETKDEQIGLISDQTENRDGQTDSEQNMSNNNENSRIFDDEKVVVVKQTEYKLSSTSNLKDRCETEEPSIDVEEEKDDGENNISDTERKDSTVPTIDRLMRNVSAFDRFKKGMFPNGACVPTTDPDTIDLENDDAQKYFISRLEKDLRQSRNLRSTATKPVDRMSRTEARLCLEVTQVIVWSQELERMNHRRSQEACERLPWSRSTKGVLPRTRMGAYVTRTKTG